MKLEIEKVLYVAETQPLKPTSFFLIESLKLSDEDFDQVETKIKAQQAKNQIPKLEVVKRQKFDEKMANNMRIPPDKFYYFDEGDVKKTPNYEHRLVKAQIDLLNEVSSESESKLRIPINLPSFSTQIEALSLSLTKAETNKYKCLETVSEFCKVENSMYLSDKIRIYIDSLIFTLTQVDVIDTDLSYIAERWEYKELYDKAISPLTDSLKDYTDAEIKLVIKKQIDLLNTLHNQISDFVIDSTDLKQSIERSSNDPKIRQQILAVAKSRSGQDIFQSIVNQTGEFNDPDIGVLLKNSKIDQSIFDPNTDAIDFNKQENKLKAKLLFADEILAELTEKISYYQSNEVKRELGLLKERKIKIDETLIIQDGSEQFFQMLKSFFIEIFGLNQKKSLTDEDQNYYNSIKFKPKSLRYKSEFIKNVDEIAKIVGELATHISNYKSLTNPGLRYKWGLVEVFGTPDSNQASEEKQKILNLIPDVKKFLQLRALNIQSGLKIETIDIDMLNDLISIADFELDNVRILPEFDYVFAGGELLQPNSDGRKYFKAMIDIEFFLGVESKFKFSNPISLANENNIKYYKNSAIKVQTETASQISNVEVPKSKFNKIKLQLENTLQKYLNQV